MKWTRSGTDIRKGLWVFTSTADSHSCEGQLSSSFESSIMCIYKINNACKFMIVIINNMHYSKPLNKYMCHRCLPGPSRLLSYSRSKALSLLHFFFNHSLWSSSNNGKKLLFRITHQWSDTPISNQISQQVQSWGESLVSLDSGLQSTTANQDTKCSPFFNN